MSSPEEEVHKLWLSLVEKAGLVVAPPALVRGQAIASANVINEQRTFQSVVRYWTRPTAARDDDAEPVATIPDLRLFTQEMLTWGANHLAEPPESLVVSLLPAYQDELRPTFVARDPYDAGKTRLLVSVLPTGTPLDRAPEQSEGWRASPQERFERLLRGTEVPAGLLFNGERLRLVYAPKGETSGWLTFHVGQMTEVGGRPMLAGLLCLLHGDCVFSRDKGRSLGELLQESRRYQATVSTALAGQVLGALHELLRGIQAADRSANGRILGSVVAEHRDHLYAGLVTVLMRLVFLLYGEDRELMPRDPVYAQHYSVVGLFERLRADDAMFPDTMDQRFGAWAHLVSLFRLVHDGGKHAGLALPARQGDLFNPDSFPFLEGRPFGIQRVKGETFDPPKVSDGVVWRVLQGLLIHDRERLSYRTLDVEQIGSVYEAIMGFGVERSPGPVLALKPKNVFVDLAKLLELPGDKRAAFLDAEAGCKVPPAGASALAAAKTVEELAAALGGRASEYARTVLPAGALYLQPGEERRRSGSHYTPRELTSPIVATTLRPVLEQLGLRPTPDQILGLKVCDPAMGSGAFLVETCRQLGEHLVEAWNVHGGMPPIPADEEPYLHARRMIAQRCLYGVDRNPMAASLAKLSLWLVTLARDHAFTFLDHALKHGDSLVGYTRRQIFSFNPKVTGAVTEGPLFAGLVANLGKVKQDRAFIQGAEEGRETEVREAFDDAEAALVDARLKGDLLVAAFFGASKPKERETLRVEYNNLWADAQASGPGRLPARERAEGIVEGLRSGPRGVVPFHWEIEFPEVFDRETPGFDCFVGNPPFVGGTMIGGRIGLEFHDHLVETYLPATGLADIVAFFLRRCFDLLRARGAFGLIATNTVAQGDTRATGLQAITDAERGGVIYAATRRRTWPGDAAVVVSVVHVAKGPTEVSALLDGVEVSRISAFLLAGSNDAMPVSLLENKRRCYLGTKIWGAGFVFEDNPSNGSSSLSDMRALLAEDPANRDAIVPYMGGEEFNDSPTLSPRRYVIEFGECTEEYARRWPSLFNIVEERVKPVRAANKQRNYRDEWWRHANRVPEAAAFANTNGRLLAATSVSRSLSFGFVSAGTIMANTVALVLLHAFEDFAVLQSRMHEVWARFSGSTFGDALRYTTPCFDTYPRPAKGNSELELIGQAYYDHRARVMIANSEGLTATYNRFHDPNERSPDILRLRELHCEMDCAVLSAYGWDDVPTDCDFVLDHDDGEEDEPATPSRRRKPYRLRWPDAVRDDVLARLLDLNAKRAAAERPAAALPPTNEASKPRKKKPSGEGPTQAPTKAAKPGKPREDKGRAAEEQPAGPPGALFAQLRS